MHESIGGDQISVSTSTSSSSSKDHRVDDTPIEHTSFGGPAQNNNNALKSREEQMTAHRRVRINKLPLFCFGSFREEIFCETQLLGSGVFFGSYARSWLFHSVVVVREQILRTSW